METNGGDDEALPVVSVLAAVFDRLVATNADLASTCQVTKFSAAKRPAIAIHDYLLRIHRYARCSPSCFVLALVYSDRLISKHDFVLSGLNVHRVVITTIMVAAKFFDDFYFDNAFYARVGGITTCELNDLEVELLCLLEWSIRVTPAEFEKYHGELMAHAQPDERLLMEQHQTRHSKQAILDDRQLQQEAKDEEEEKQTQRRRELREQGGGTGGGPEEAAACFSEATVAAAVAAAALSVGNSSVLVDACAAQDDVVAVADSPAASPLSPGPNGGKEPRCESQSVEGRAATRTVETSGCGGSGGDDDGGGSGVGDDADGVVCGGSPQLPHNDDRESVDLPSGPASHSNGGGDERGETSSKQNDIAGDRPGGDDDDDEDDAERMINAFIGCDDDDDDGAASPATAPPSLPADSSSLSSLTATSAAAVVVGSPPETRQPSTSAAKGALDGTAHLTAAVAATAAATTTAAASATRSPSSSPHFWQRSNPFSFARSFLQQSPPTAQAHPVSLPAS
mmetsp:Transcript_51066/g.94946  ORF Transcript_51066/g.94946 Transcript_51066/m.94946 type:complete len:511 (-) Transcript_51066:86-1618(-)